MGVAKMDKIRNNISVNLVLTKYNRSLMDVIYFVHSFIAINLASGHNQSR
jgi:hypothetical protein